MAKRSFEQNMQRLNEISSEMEAGDISLEASVKLYKEAVKLAKALKEELNGAKAEIVVLNKDLEGIFTGEGVVSDEF